MFMWPKPSTSSSPQRALTTCGTEKPAPGTRDPERLFKYPRVKAAAARGIMRTMANTLTTERVRPRRRSLHTKRYKTSADGSHVHFSKSAVFTLPRALPYKATCPHAHASKRGAKHRGAVARSLSDSQPIKPTPPTTPPDGRRIWKRERVWEVGSRDDTVATWRGSFSMPHPT